MAKPLLKEAGIASILIENPFYILLVLLHVPDYRGLRLPSHRLEIFLWQYTATDRIEFLPVPSINNYKYNVHVFLTDENMS